ncbi:hypothetical protein M3I53_16575 [Paraburkholderia sp. CNPSo 3272]|uniref:hypothetical protein n=1 Tax=Paraburkholderia sp. CNPSo 3272 TaxID=2940931 RepID=UPI0020B67FCC|nr:hypothetical protein [Paraburkholderia sp. CNPSo 3272]MCP3724718.1 hypothetical protein [Paraburkholderia sp. CNPSo 3272]
MSERDNEIADLAKDILGNIVQGMLASGKALVPADAANAAMQCATALVDQLADVQN